MRKCGVDTRSRCALLANTAISEYRSNEVRVNSERLLEDGITNDCVPVRPLAALATRAPFTLKNNGRRATSTAWDGSKSRKKSHKLIALT